MARERGTSTTGSNGKLGEDDMYRTRKSQSRPLEVWNVEVRGTASWCAVGHVKRVMWEHYLAYFGQALLGSTTTRRAAVNMVVDRAESSSSTNPSMKQVNPNRCYFLCGQPATTDTYDRSGRSVRACADCARRWGGVSGVQTLSERGLFLQRWHQS